MRRVVGASILRQEEMIVLLSDKKLSWHAPFIQGAHYEAAPTRGLTVLVCSACYTVMERLPEAAFATVMSLQQISWDCSCNLLGVWKKKNCNLHKKPAFPVDLLEDLNHH